MLERILEPEVMDTVEEASDYDQMDHSLVNRTFVDDLIDADCPDGLLLDLGTGTAQIPVELCQRLPGLRVLAVDLAGYMLDIANVNVEAASLSEAISLDQVDAKELPYDDDEFDAVISNSIVHHIPDPLLVLKEAVRVTRPEGMLFFRDLMRPDTQQELDELVQQYAGEEVDHAQQMFRDSLHAALRVDELADMIQSLGFDRNGVAASSDRHWTWIARA